MNNQSILEPIRKLIVQNRLIEAMNRLTGIWEKSPKYSELLSLYARFQEVSQKERQGTINQQDASTLMNGIRSALLQLIDMNEEEYEQWQSTQQNPQGINQDISVEADYTEIVDTNFAGTSIQIHDSKEVLLGSGNTISKKIYAALGTRQFLGLVVGMILLGTIGYWGISRLMMKQNLGLHSLAKIHNELQVLTDTDEGAKTKWEEKGEELQILLEKGMKALKRQEYKYATDYLEKFSEEIPLATVHQNLSLAYQGMNLEEEEKVHLKRAKEIDPSLEMGLSSLRKTEKVRRNISGINLLAPRNGGTIETISDDNLKQLTDGLTEDIESRYGHSITFSFKDKRSASFHVFTHYVARTWDGNVSHLVLYAGNESPRGKFEVIDTIEPFNGKVLAAPFQEFDLEDKKIKAKYFRVKILGANGSYRPFLSEIELWGKLD